MLVFFLNPPFYFIFFFFSFISSPQYLFFSFVTFSYIFYQLLLSILSKSPFSSIFFFSISSFSFPIFLFFNSFSVPFYHPYYVNLVFPLPVCSPSLPSVYLSHTCLSTCPVSLAAVITPRSGESERVTHRRAYK